MGEQLHPIITSEREETLFNEGDLATTIAGGALGAFLRRLRQIEEDPIL
jgi:hypothetical protein